MTSKCWRPASEDMPVIVVLSGVVETPHRRLLPQGSPE